MRKDTGYWIKRKKTGNRRRKSECGRGKAEGTTKL
jgi:hypothetical protein